MFTRKNRRFRARHKQPVLGIAFRLSARRENLEAATRIRKARSTRYLPARFTRFVGQIASAALIAVIFHIVLAASILNGTADRASLNNGDISISLKGANPLQEECGDSFSDPGATATNGAGKSVPVHVSGQVDSRTPGTYTLTYSAADDKDSTSVERTVNIVDTTPPEIALEGGNTMTVSCSGTFVEPGATATDSCQGKVPVIISGSVNPNLPGTYSISYAATDAHNNTKTVTRRVIVGSSEDNPPTITLSGDGEIKIECGGNFIDPGATANTACSGTVPIATSGSVDVNTPGGYTIKYAAASGELMAEASRLISIEDTTPPLISLKGNSPMTIVRGSTFTDPGATAQDGCAGDFAATASGTVEQNTIGSYTITYTASDPSGNQATPVMRTVNVVEPTQPPATSYPSLVNLFRVLYGFPAWGNVTSVRVR